MTAQELAIQDAAIIAKELIARDELKLAEAILEQCIERAKSFESKETMYNCSVLMMYCKRDDDEFLKEAKDQIPLLIMSPPQNNQDRVAQTEIFQQHNACRYTVIWNLIFIYREKLHHQTDEDLKKKYNIIINLYGKIIAQNSYSRVRDITIEKAPCLMMSCGTSVLKQEAEEILKLLSQDKFSNPATVYELSARCKNMTGEVDAALECCNQALSLTSNSSSKLELKLDILLKHIRLHLNNSDDVKLILTLEEYVAIRPSAEMYFKLGLAYCRQSNFHEAYIAFRRARVQDKEYECENISLNIIHALFQSAQTHKQFKTCAIKLSNHLSRYPSTERIAAIQTMIDYFREEKLLLDSATLYHPEPGTPRKKLRPLKEESDESNWCVPQDIRDKTRKALQRMSFYHDKSVSGRDALDEQKINLDELHPMGGESNHTYAYIPHGKIPQDRLDKYLLAIKHPMKGPGSKGVACPKKLTDGRVEIKIKGKGAKYRLLSTASFFTFKMNKAAGEDGSDTKQLDTIYRFSSEKAHNQV